VKRFFQRHIRVCKSCIEKERCVYMTFYSMKIENYKIFVYRGMIAVIKINDLIYLLFNVMCGFNEDGRGKKSGLWRP